MGRKILKSIVISVLVVFCLFAFTACEVKFEANKNGTVTGADASVEMIEAFFADTLKETNFVVTLVSTTKKGEATKTTTTINSIYGTSAKLQSDGNDQTIYCFVVGDEYYVARESESEKYYITGKDEYDYYRNYYFGYSSNWRNRPHNADEIDDFSCSKTDDSLTFSMKSKKTNQTATVNATKENGKITSVRYEFSRISDEKSETRSVIMTFEYGKASFEIPDITDWSNMTKTTVVETAE